jgi:hypothetical protein
MTRYQLHRSVCDWIRAGEVASSEGGDGGGDGPGTNSVAVAGAVTPARAKASLMSPSAPGSPAFAARWELQPDLDAASATAQA